MSAVIAESLVGQDDYLWLVGPEWEATERAWAQDDLISFIRRLSPRYRPAWFHFLIAEKLEAVIRGDILRLIIVMPPRFGKSTLASRYFPAYFLGKCPDQRIIATSYADRLATRFGRFTRNVIADSAYPFDIKLAKDSRASEQFDIAYHVGGYFAAGVGGGITGEGADVLLIDDAVKGAAEADSEAFREGLIEWYTETAYPRLEAGGRIVMIGTRWRDDDLIGYVLDQQEVGGDEWDVLHLPAINDAGDPLWPERYGLDELQKRKNNMSSRMWEAQYQGNPVPAEGGMFKRKWWQTYDRLPDLTKVELLMDSAFKEGVENDFSVVACWGYDGHGSSYLIRVWRERVAFPELLKLAHSAHDWAKREFPTHRVPLVIEDKASGQSAIQTLKRPLPQMQGAPLPALPVIPFPVKSTENKIARAEGVTPVVEGGRAFIPKHATWELDEWIKEHERFPLSVHDDQVDTTSMALKRFYGSKGRAWGFN